MKNYIQKIGRKVHQKYIDLSLYLKNTLETEKNAYFISTGFFFPVLFSAYKYCLGKNTVILYPFIGYIILDKILEPLLLVILPCYIIFLYTSKRDDLFYYNFWSKIPFIFPFFLFFCRLIIYFCKNIFFGCLFILFLFLLYLYCDSKELPIMNLKTLIIPPLFAFRFLLLNSCKNSWPFKICSQFFFIKSQLVGFKPQLFSMVGTF